MVWEVGGDQERSGSIWRTNGRDRVGPIWGALDILTGNSKCEMKARPSIHEEAHAPMKERARWQREAEA